MTISRRNTLAVLAAGLLPLSDVFGAPLPEPLKVLGKRKGLNVGNAIGIGRGHATGKFFNDPGYLALMARECNVLVTDNECKWPALEPRQGQYNYAPADRMFAWAREQGMKLRGHNLMWQPVKWQPKWVNEYDFGAQPAREAERLMREHIRTACGHFGTSIYSWDVMNEAVDPADGGLRANVFTERLGAIEQIDLSFRLAHEYAPHAQLVYNDYMRADEGSARHRAGVLKLLHELKSRGTPVHALGLQSHIGSWDEMGNYGGDRNLREWRKFLDEASGMGLDLLITEFDVNDRKLPADIVARDAGVAALAKDYLDVTFSYPNCRDFVMWGMADDFSWLQGWDEAPRLDGVPMRPTPFDSKFKGKPLRTAIADAIKAMPPRAA
jgi:endo-1,4-beta-xylanase